MASGVKFAIATGETETFRRLDNGLIEAHLEFAPGETARTLLAKGIYLLEVVDFKDGAPVSGTRSSYSFPLPAADMPDPTPGGGWSVAVGKLDRGDLGSEAQVYSFGAPAVHTIGPCSYQMLPIEIRYPQDADNARRDVLHYLPELGLSYLAEYYDKESSEVYAYIGIETVK